MGCLDGALVNGVANDLEEELELIQSGVALRLPPHSKFGDALYFDFSFEILQSSNLAVAAAVLPFHSNLFRICARSN